MVLLERLGQVLVHLCLDALLAITHHGMGRERDDGSALIAQAPLILANLGCGLKTALEIDSVSFDIKRSDTWQLGQTNHDWHLDIHQNDIKLPPLHSLNRLLTVADHSHNVMVFFKDLDR